MKVARFARVRPVLTVGELFGSTDSGPSGQVPTATGSNGNPIIWGSNVANIFSNTSNHLIGPDINFLSGSGIAFAASSNSLTISATGTVTGGGGPSASAGINAAAVRRWTINPFASTTSHVTTITAADSGQRMIVGIASYNRDVNTPTCTNTTFTQVLAANFSTTSYLSVYVGVVAGGSSGTTVTVTATGADNIFTTVVILDDALSAAVVDTATTSGTSASAGASTLIGPIACTVGDFLIMGFSTNDASQQITAMHCSSPLFMVPGDSLHGHRLAIGRAGATDVSCYYVGGTGGADYAAGIVAIT